MARKQPLVVEPEPQLRIAAVEAMRRIDDRINKGQELAQRTPQNSRELFVLESDYERWDSYNKEMLAQIFTTKRLAEEYGEYAGSLEAAFEEPSHAQQFLILQRQLGTKIERLRSIKDRLELFPVSMSDPPATDFPKKETGSRTNKVFVVHGHDEAAKATAARFLEKFGLEAIILHEQPTEGRTLVEKLERYSDVDFAVVLLTPDDVGAKAAEPNALQARARQNVILELGFFAGKLGRKHVCALYRGPLELPSDYVGVAYVEMDARGAWRMELARELRAAGFSIDMNLL